MTRRIAVGSGWKRGAAAAAAVLLLALTQVLIVSTISPSSSEGHALESRVLSARARYAAEAGVRIIIARLEAGEDPPAEGVEIDLGTAQVVFVRSPESGVGEIVVEGKSGIARRRLSVLVQ